MLLALTGGALGLVAAWGTLRSLYPLLLARLPQEVQSLPLNLNLDVRILFYSLLLSFATGAAFGLVPALQTSNLDLNSSLKGTGASFAGRSGGWLRGSLIAAQIAVCLVLLIAAGLLVRGLQAAQTIDPGFEMKDIAAASFDLRLEGYDQPRAAAFNRQLADRLATHAGIDEVGFVDSVPLSGSRRGTMGTVAGRDEKFQITDARVSANYFQLLGIPVVRGRAFEPGETTGDGRSIILSQSAARRLWPGEDPIGKRLLFDDGKTATEVVGVVKDIRASSLSAVDPIFLYHPAGPKSQVGLSILVRGKAGYAAIAKSIRDETRALDPNVLVQSHRLEDNLDLWQLPSRILSMLALALGIAGLILASIGIYGVMAYAVTQRTKEIGIRMTMGAQRRDVVRLILGQAMRPVAIGIALGLAGSAAVSGILSSLLYGLNRLDPAVFGGVSLFLAAIALLAGYVPAQRATRVDPMTALRHD
jgi:predicted permease